MIRPRANTLLLLLVLLTAEPAWAQEAKPPEPPVSGATTAPADAAKQEAARRFEHAIKLYEDADYTLALAEFERVYELVPDYRVLYNIGQVNTQLGHYARAFRTLKEYLVRGGAELPSDRARGVEADLDALSGKIASISVEVAPAGAEISIDGRVVGTAPLTEPLVVDVGERRLEAKLGGYVAKSQNITLAGGDRRQLRLTLEPVVANSAPLAAPAATTLATAPTRPLPAPRTDAGRSWTWLGWASTGALATGAVVAGAIGASAASDLRQLRGTAGVSRLQLDQAHNRATSRLLIADILGGAALAAGGITLYLQLSKSSTTEQTAAGSTWRLALAPNQVAVVYEP